VIETARMNLLPCDAETLRAVVAGREALAAHLAAAVPEGWPVFPEAYAHALDVVVADPGIASWWTHLFLEREGPSLVGAGGYTGRPSPEGVVEIGYEIAPAFRGRALAIEAARGLVEHAFADAAVTAVIAHTRPETGASTRVLEKIGFARVEDVEDREEGTLWRWRITRGQTPFPRRP
jgi:RimJ/RimL family protein N-acetyltransferase